MTSKHIKLQRALKQAIVNFFLAEDLCADELRIQGTVCVTADKSAIFVTQITETITEPTVDNSYQNSNGMHKTPPEKPPSSEPAIGNGRTFEEVSFPRTVSAELQRRFEYQAQQQQQQQISQASLPKRDVISSPLNSRADHLSAPFPGNFNPPSASSSYYRNSSAHCGVPVNEHRVPSISQPAEPYIPTSSIISDVTKSELINRSIMSNTLDYISHMRQMSDIQGNRSDADREERVLYSPSFESDDANDDDEPDIKRQRHESLVAPSSVKLHNSPTALRESPHHSKATSRTSSSESLEPNTPNHDKLLQHGTLSERHDGHRPRELPPQRMSLEVETTSPPLPSWLLGNLPKSEPPLTPTLSEWPMNSWIRKPKTKFSQDQIQALENEYRMDPFLSTSADRRAELARKLNLTEKNIQIWFQNQRRRRRAAAYSKLHYVFSDPSGASVTGGMVLSSSAPIPDTDGHIQDSHTRGQGDMNANVSSAIHRNPAASFLSGDHTSPKVEPEEFKG